MHSSSTRGRRRPRAMRLCRLGELGRCFRPNHASMPTDAARTSGVGEIAHATGNQTRAVVKCMLRVHLSSAEPGRCDFAARRARMQCQTDASPFGHVIGLSSVEKRAHHTISSTHSRRMHDADVLWRGTARGTRNTRARGMLAVACLMCASVASCNGWIRSDFIKCIPHFSRQKLEFCSENAMYFEHGIVPICSRARPRNTKPHIQELEKHSWPTRAGVAGGGRIEFAAR